MQASQASLQPPESKPVCTRQNQSRPLSDLPDLTEALIEQGVYGEYSSWRDSYFKWRRGEARGAKGENSHVEHTARKRDNQAFEYWYPTVSAFTFRRTCSYWVAVLIAEGCILYIFIPVFSIFLRDTVSEQMQFALTKLLSASGGFLFTLGCYMGYFELINMNVDLENGEAIQYFWCDWWDLRESLGLPWSSIMGWVLYMVGGLLFQLSVAAACFPLSGTLNECLVGWPGFLSGMCFAFGGLCEAIQNRILFTLPNKLVWWVSAINTAGGFTFWLGKFPSLLSTKLEADVIDLFTAVCYVMASLLMLCMWRGEQFGLALISVLNAVHRDKGTKIAVRKDLRTGQEHSVVCGLQQGGEHMMEDMKDVVEPQLSWRGILFVMLYVFCGALQVMTCCASLALYLSSRSESSHRHHVTTFVQGIANLLAVHMVLALCSACVRVPKEQPYRALVIMVRAMVFIISLNSLLTFELGFEDDTAAQV